MPTVCPAGKGTQLQWWVVVAVALAACAATVPTCGAYEADPSSGVPPPPTRGEKNKANTYERVVFNHLSEPAWKFPVGACTVDVGNNATAILGGGHFDMYNSQFRSKGNSPFASTLVFVRSPLDHALNTVVWEIPEEFAVMGATCFALPREEGEKYSKILVFGGAQRYQSFDRHGRLHLHFTTVTNRTLVVNLNLREVVVTILEPKGPAPPPRALHAWAPDHRRSTLYMFGGSTFAGKNGERGKVFHDLWAFDLATMAWSEIKPTGGGGASWPVGRSGHAMRAVPASVEHGGAVLVFGGCSTAGREDPLRDGCWAMADGTNGTLNDLWELKTAPTASWVRIAAMFGPETSMFEGGWPSPRAFMGSYGAVAGFTEAFNSSVMGVMGGNAVSHRENVTNNQIDTDVEQDYNWFEYDYSRRLWVRRVQRTRIPKSEESALLDEHRFPTMMVMGTKLYHLASLRYIKPAAIQARASHGVINLESYIFSRKKDGRFRLGNVVANESPLSEESPVGTNFWGSFTDEGLAVFGGQVRKAYIPQMNLYTWDANEGIWTMDIGRNGESNIHTWMYKSLFEMPWQGRWPGLQSYSHGGVFVGYDLTPKKAMPDVNRVTTEKQTVDVYFEGTSMSFFGNMSCFEPLPGDHDPGMVLLGGFEPLVAWSGRESDPVYMYGGQPTCMNGEMSNQLLAFDLVQRRWSNLTATAMGHTAPGMYPPPLTGGRAAVAAGGDLVFMFGGSTGPSSTFSNDMYRLDVSERSRCSFRLVENRRESEHDTVPPRLDSPSLTPIRYGDETDVSWLVVYGGLMEEYTQNERLYMFNVFSERWRSVGLAGSPVGLSQHAALWHPRLRQLYIFGGIHIEIIDSKPVTTLSTDVAVVRPGAAINEETSSRRHCVRMNAGTRCFEGRVFVPCNMASYTKSHRGERADGEGCGCLPCPEGTERLHRTETKCSVVQVSFCRHGFGYVDEFGSARCVCDFGYGGRRCEVYTWAIVSGGVLAFLIVAGCVAACCVIGGSRLYSHFSKRTLARLNEYKKLHDGSQYSSSKSCTEKWDINPDAIRIEGRVGCGASAIVYRGRWQGNDVAVKEFVDVTDNGVLLEKEMDMLTSLSHPNIVRTWGCSLNRCYLVMEFCHRGTLDEVIHSENTVKSPAEYDLRARTIITEVARGMMYLHSLQPPVLHRDLKPENILIDSNWVVKIADFGLSKRMDIAEMYMTRGAGTPSYCAPEVWERSTEDRSSTQNFTTKADVFSFGIMLHEIVYRKRPYDECNFAVEVTQRIAQGERPHTSLQDISRVRPLYSLMERCWHQDPAERPEFDEIVSILEKAQTWVSVGSC